MSNSPDRNTRHDGPERVLATIREPRVPQLVQSGASLLERTDLRNVVVPGTADALEKFFITGRDLA
ncbi:MULTISPECIES: hypothetical protein [unclassified Streptomyces]|uniref:hypothetical protein n=1 Tax=unclassified Streptomyces TaxID=2593676 RepID=UPI00225B4E66|nr:hypothetical protein [Streptomyces sp. NBC_01264]MCX4783971.1 hypothetical protein [Streptomyces sp. NBC_01264]